MGEVSQLELFAPRCSAEQKYLQRILEYGFAPSVTETIRQASCQEGAFLALNEEDVASHLVIWQGGAKLGALCIPCAPERMTLSVSWMLGLYSAAC